MRCFFHSPVSHPLIFLPKAQRVLDSGSHFASKAMRARSREARANLRDKVYAFMLEKSELSDYEVIEYIKKES